MKHYYCYDVDITNVDYIYYAILDCFTEKWHRDDVIDYLHDYLPSWDRKEIKKITYDIANRERILSNVIWTIAEDLSWEIKNRSINIHPIRYSKRFDGASRKMREIGIQTIKHQILDHIAVRACHEMWGKRIAPYQCASIAERGQIYGKKMIERAIRNKPEDAIYAVKGDIHKCYPSINVKILKKKLENDIDNPDLIYLLFFLIDTFKEGLSIGSYLSQFLSNYYISFICRGIERKYAKKYTAQIYYMDDFLIIGKDKTVLIAIMKETIQKFKDELDLEVKPNWEVFPIDRLCAGRKRRGRPIDMMGYIIYRDHTEIRDTIFLRARRCYLDTYLEYTQFNRWMPPSLAHKCISYFGWFKNSNSNYFIKEYNVKKITNMSKTAVSFYNKKGGKKLCSDNEAVYPIDDDLLKIAAVCPREIKIENSRRKGGNSCIV